MPDLVAAAVRAPLDADDSRHILGGLVEGPVERQQPVAKTGWASRIQEVLRRLDG